MLSPRSTRRNEALNEEAARHIAEAAKGVASSGGDLFEVLDMNKDGFISRSEFLAALENREVSKSAWQMILGGAGSGEQRRPRVSLGACNVSRNSLPARGADGIRRGQVLDWQQLPGGPLLAHGGLPARQHTPTRLQQVGSRVEPVPVMCGSIEGSSLAPKAAAWAPCADCSASIHTSGSRGTPSNVQCGGSSSSAATPRAVGVVRAYSTPQIVQRPVPKHGQVASVETTGSGRGTPIVRRMSSMPSLQPPQPQHPQQQQGVTIATTDGLRLHHQHRPMTSAAHVVPASTFPPSTERVVTQQRGVQQVARMATDSLSDGTRLLSPSRYPKHTSTAAPTEESLTSTSSARCLSGADRGGEGTAPIREPVVAAPRRQLHPQTLQQPQVSSSSNAAQQQVASPAGRQGDPRSGVSMSPSRLSPTRLHAPTASDLIATATAAPASGRSRSPLEHEVVPLNLQVAADEAFGLDTTWPCGDEEQLVGPAWPPRRLPPGSTLTELVSVDGSPSQQGHSNGLQLQPPQSSAPQQTHETVAFLDACSSPWLDAEPQQQLGERRCQAVHPDSGQQALRARQPAADRGLDGTLPLPCYSPESPILSAEAEDRLLLRTSSLSAPATEVETPMLIAVAGGHPSGRHSSASLGGSLQSPGRQLQNLTASDPGVITPTTSSVEQMRQRSQQEHQVDAVMRTAAHAATGLDATWPCCAQARPSPCRRGAWPSHRTVAGCPQQAGAVALDVGAPQQVRGRQPSNRIAEIPAAQHTRFQWLHGDATRQAMDARLRKERSGEQTFAVAPAEDSPGTDMDAAEWLLQEAESLEAEEQLWQARSSDYVANAALQDESHDGKGAAKGAAASPRRSPLTGRSAAGADGSSPEEANRARCQATSGVIALNGGAAGAVRRWPGGGAAASVMPGSRLQARLQSDGNADAAGGGVVPAIARSHTATALEPESGERSAKALHQSGTVQHRGHGQSGRSIGSALGTRVLLQPPVPAVEDAFSPAESQEEADLGERDRRSSRERQQAGAGDGTRQVQLPADAARVGPGACGVENDQRGALGEAADRSSRESPEVGVGDGGQKAQLRPDAVDASHSVCEDHAAQRGSSGVVNRSSRESPEAGAGDGRQKAQPQTDEAHAGHGACGHDTAQRGSVSAVDGSSRDSPEPGAGDGRQKAQLRTDEAHASRSARRHDTAQRGSVGAVDRLSSESPEAGAGDSRRKVQLHTDEAHAGCSARRHDTAQRGSVGAMDRESPEAAAADGMQKAYPHTSAAHASPCACETNAAQRGAVSAADRSRGQMGRRDMEETLRKVMGRLEDQLLVFEEFLLLTEPQVVWETAAA